MKSLEILIVTGACLFSAGSSAALTWWRMRNAARRAEKAAWRQADILHRHRSLESLEP